MKSNTPIFKYVLLVFYVFAVLDVFVVSGCGPGSTGSGVLTAPQSNRGTVALIIRWPQIATSRLIPVAANSIHVVVQSSQKSSEGDQLVQRPSNGALSQSLQFISILAGTLTITATAFASTDGSGTALAGGSTTVTVSPDQTAQAAVTMQSSINRIVISSQSLTTVAGSTLDISASALDSTNAVVMTTASTWSWSSDNTTIASVTNNGYSAVITGVKPGTVHITATESESQKSSVVTVTISALIANTYNVVDLGTTPNQTSSVANGINDSGQVVGTSYSSGSWQDSSDGHVFLWSKQAGLKDLGMFGGAPSSGVAINNGGTVLAMNQTSGYTWTNGTSSQIIPPPLTRPGGIIRVLPTGLNDSGVVIGLVEAAVTGAEGYGFSYPFTVQGSTATDLSSLPISGDVSIYGINDSGQVVGAVDGGSQSGTYGILLVLPSTILGLSPSSTDAYTLPSAISSNGHISGTAKTSGAVYWASPTTQVTRVGTLGTSSQGLAVNDNGQVVGISVLPDGSTQHAFVWSPTTQIADLNTLIPLNSGWVLTSATGINTSGQIVGYGAINGAIHAYLLQPN